MLLQGEAIFGVVDFAADSLSVNPRVEKLMRRASDLGVEATHRNVGGAVLGGIHSATTEELDTDSTGVFAVTAGQLWDRSRARGCFETEPHRRRFLVDGYRAGGTSFLDCLDGTFAAALWDDRERSLVLICDRRADAHLYYRVDGDQLIFSSWLDLLYEPSIEIDRQAVKEFLRFLYIAPPRTIYQGIARLEGGAYMTAAHGRIETMAFPAGDTANGHGIGDTDPSVVLTNFQDLFERAVRRRLICGRVGMFLSSGIDSATLAVACQRINPGRIETFTIGFDDTELDETDAAGAFARQLGVPHTVLKFDLSQYRHGFDRMARQFEQPYGDPAGLAFVLACEELKDRVDVFGDGSGSDTLFGSPIPRHLRFSLSVSANMPRMTRRFVASLLRTMPIDFLSGNVELFDFDDVEELFITWHGWRKRELQALFGERICFAESGFYRRFRARQELDSQELYDSLGVFPPEDCRLEASAAAGPPIGMPFYDTALVAYVRDLPRHFRMSEGATKVLLWRLFQRYLPEVRFTANKHYLNMPLQALLANNNFAIVREYLAPRRLDSHGLVDSLEAWRWIDRYLAGDDSLVFKVWSLLVLHAWLELRNQSWIR